MTSLTITQHDQAGRGEYRAEVDGALSKLTYERREDLVADYAYLPAHQRRADIALQLVKALVEDAQAEAFKIIPTCGYISATMRRHREWDALRA